MTDILNNLLTQSGRKNQLSQYGFDPSGRDNVSAMFKGLASGYYPGAASATAFGTGLEDQRQKSIMDFINSYNPANLHAQANTLGQQAITGGASAAHQASLANRQMGYGDGFNAGTSANLIGQGQNQANQIQQQYASPEFRQQVYSNIIQAILQGMQNPFIGLINSTEQPVQYYSGLRSQERAQRSQNSLGTLGTLGQLAGYF